MVDQPRSRKDRILGNKRYMEEGKERMKLSPRAPNKGLGGEGSEKKLTSNEYPLKGSSAVIASNPVVSKSWLCETLLVCKEAAGSSVEVPPPDVFSKSTCG